jgi:hypothetical protein
MGGAMQRIITLTVLVVLAALMPDPLFAQPYHRRHKDPVERALQDAYEKAIYDSAVYRCSNLRPLCPLEPDSRGEVLLATLTNVDGTVGSLIVAPSDGIWVAGAPELHDRCREFTGDVVMKLRQLLGLPPDADVPRVLELRARITDVFRPAPDSNVRTSAPCPPLGDVMLPCNCGTFFPPSTTSTHYQWMASQEFMLHELPGGYPWTHLGYTYNWAPEADRYGASEYVIRGGAAALIVKNVSPTEYCANTK